MPLICLAGIGASRAFREAACAPLRLGIITGLAFLAFFLPFRVTLSEFAIGGHWGPRMLLPAAPAFVALALAAVQRPRGVRNRVGFAVAAVFVAAGLLSSALAVSMLDAQKRAVGALQRRLAATSQQVLVTTHPALGQHLAEFWGERALLLARNPAHLSALAADLQQRDVAEFLLVWQPRPRFGPPRVDGARCTPSGRHRDVEVRRVFDVDFYTCTFPPVTSSGSSRRPIRSGDAPLGEDPRRTFDAALALHTRDRRDDLARTHGP